MEIKSGDRKQMNRKVIIKRLLADNITPAAAYAALGGGEYSFLLESAERGINGRYSYIGISPERVYRLMKDSVEVIQKSDDLYELAAVVRTDDPMGYIGRIIEKRKIEKKPELPPFCGGLLGFLSYEMISTWESIEFPEDKDGEGVLGVLVEVDEIIEFDHFHNTASIIKLCGEEVVPSDEERLKELSALLGSITPLKTMEIGTGDRNIPKYTSSFTREEFIKEVERIKERIVSGDIIQGVLSQRLSAGAPEDPFRCYRALRSVNPSPYMFYMKFSDMIICGASPELMVKLEGDRASLRPIAGTHRRSSDENKDKALEKELREDLKEQAEHVMLVDLGRNDLSRVSEPGSVKIDNFMTVERYSHVMHLVTDVSCDIRPEKGAVEVFKATFPAGTVSGAPKIRAVEIIRDSEKAFRGAYGGAAGYFSYTGDMDMCITIRSMVISNGIVQIQAGAGIVKDSIPESEYQETLNKAGALLEALSIALDSEEGE